MLVALAGASLCALAVAVADTGVSEGHHREGGKELRNGCHRLYPQARFYRYTERRYRVRPALTKGQKRYILRMARCQHTRRAQRWSLRKRRLYIHRRATRLRRAAERRAYYRLTPYVCANGTRWAIPCSIIACESGYSWSAYNPSGARGPYQFLGWNVPWPVTSWADRMAHHRMGARLWAGGAGRSHWVC